ncbi:hypothetical protein [Streptomyces sp. CB01881]|uniref:hypothetical protein n=1 Tax=Streptomyces sp. CB01881 TaxID=2078691 RepID=UPI000CDC5DF0|nr:hypothetical protein [Streptomyces sp. CB01881]AUY48535.1 hypothetical protein C2142_05705 [Streptomyces sp. CB01881]TYC77022.1 hypothetical protein EH183_05720 [Streptomyces sp. CB01881]
MRSARTLLAGAVVAAAALTVAAPAAFADGSDKNLTWQEKQDKAASPDGQKTWDEKQDKDSSSSGSSGSSGYSGEEQKAEEKAPHGGVHTGGGGLALSGGGLASGAVLLLGGLGAGAIALRKGRRSAGAAI